MDHLIFIMGIDIPEHMVFILKQVPRTYMFLFYHKWWLLFPEWDDNYDGWPARFLPADHCRLIYRKLQNWYHGSQSWSNIWNRTRNDRTCHPGGNQWNNYPGAPSLNQVTATHLKIRHPCISSTGAWLSNELQRLHYITGYQDNSPSKAWLTTWPLTKWHL